MSGKRRRVSSETSVRRRYRRITEHEQEAMEALKGLGWSFSGIGRAFGRHHYAVQRRLSAARMEQNRRDRESRYAHKET